MTPAVFILIIIALANVGIGAYVWNQRPGSAANWSFALLAATVALWTSGIILTHHGLFLITIFTRFTFASASLIPVTILLFFHTFPHETRLRLGPVSKLVLVMAGLFSIASFTPAIVKSASLETGRLRVDYGPVYTLYGLYICGSLAWSCRVFLSRYLRATGLTRLQFRYFALSLLVAGGGVTTTNLLIPLLSHDSHYGQYGPYFGLIFLVSTAHLLIRYRFLDIRLVLQRSATFLLALIIYTAALTASILLLAVAFGSPLTSTEVLFLVIGAIALGLSLNPLRSTLSRLLDSYTYRAQPDYPSTLRTTSAALTRILDLDSLAGLIVRTVLHAVRPERATLYLRSESDFIKAFEQSYLELPSPFAPPRIPEAAALIQHSRTSPDALVTEELSRRSSVDPALLDELTSSHIAVSVPIVSEHRLTGILVLAPKLSGDPFFPEDIAFISTLAGQAATAIANANLYQQVLLINEYLHNILSTMESGVIAISQHRTITLFNRAAENLTGLSREATINKTVDCLPSELREPLIAPLNLGRPLRQIDTTLLDSDNRFVPLVCSSSPLTDTRGTILGSVLVFSDLTLLKHLEAEKQQAERLASLGALASGIAHEIKNPLVAIKTFAELLPERFTDAEFRDDFARVVTTEIDRIDELVAKLSGLAISRQPLFATVDIRLPLEDTLRLLHAHLAQQNIGLRRNFTADHPFVNGDVAQLKQLFLNILLNAIQSMPAGGTLSITLSNAVASSSRRLLVDIADSGVGIPSSLLPRIFEPFVTTKPFGSGLGLAICRNIADIHRAIITASNNTTSSGATISLDFPAHDPLAFDETVLDHTDSVRSPVFTPSHSKNLES